MTPIHTAQRARRAHKNQHVALVKLPLGADPGQREEAGRLDVATSENGMIVCLATHPEAAILFCGRHYLY